LRHPGRQRITYALVPLLPFDGVDEAARLPECEFLDFVE
jgi:hypothetical protein